MICIFACLFQFDTMKLPGIKYIFLAILLSVSVFAAAQFNVKDTAVRVSMFYPTYGFSMPGGDMAKRFGFSSEIGAGFMYKGTNGWSISIEGNFIFRDGVKNQSTILSGITTSDGNIIDEGGFLANVMLLERGFSVFAKVGKLYPLAHSNPNSGLLFQFGGGMLQHKIRIQDVNNSSPQLSGEYRKGYDHLCSGPAISQFIGYQYLANNRKINFFAGLEFVQAYTFSQRAYYFNERIRPNEKRIDLLSSVKFGWYLPLYKKALKKYYYY